MQKPSNYDELTVNEHVPIRLGGHQMVIVDVREAISSTGKNMFIIMFDFAQDDVQPEMFSKISEHLSNSDETVWPSDGTGYVILTEEDNQCTRMFKSFIRAIENSNPDFQMKWTDGNDFTDQFIGQKIGGVFGNVESLYNGMSLTRRKLRWFCSTEAASGAVAPPDKRLKDLSETDTAPVITEEVSDDDNPF